MTPFVLIIMIYAAGSGGGNEVHSINFGDGESCENAKFQVDSVASRHDGSYRFTHTFCQPRSELKTDPEGGHSFDK